MTSAAIVLGAGGLALGLAAALAQLMGRDRIVALSLLLGAVALAASSTVHAVGE